MNIQYNTAKLAKDKGFNVKGQTVFDLTNNNEIVNFKDLAIQEFFDDIENGYRDKSLQYLKDGINRTDDNTDEGYYLLAPTQSELQKWLRDINKIHVEVSHRTPNSLDTIEYFGTVYNYKTHHYMTELNDYTETGFCKSYEEALEKGLISALNLI